MGQTYQSIVIDAPVDKVWNAIKDFHDMSWAPNVISKLEPVGGKKGHEPGAKRVLNGVFHETLQKVDAKAHVVEYTIDNGPSPVAKEEVGKYVGHLHAKPITEGENSGTFVEWSSKWEKDSADTTEFCHGIYVALLTDMKKSLE